MVNKKLSIGFIGAGRLAFQLAPRLSVLGFNVAQVISLKVREAEKLGNMVGAVSNDRISALMPGMDLVMLTVPDQELEGIYHELIDYRGYLIHTSGSVPLQPMSVVRRKCGVLYPLQTFSYNRLVDWKQIPIFIEGSDKSTEQILFLIARELSETVVKLDSDHRKILHMAAVWANNFTNHMLVVAQQIMETANLEGEWLNELVRETIHKAIDIGAQKAQTGPAIRNDHTTIGTHLELLHQNEHLVELYQYLTESIQANYNNESIDN